MPDGQCFPHRTTWQTSLPTTASATSVCPRGCTLTVLSWWSWATLLRTVQRTPPLSTAMPSPTHHSTCKTISKLQGGKTLILSSKLWAFRLLQVLEFVMIKNSHAKNKGKHSEWDYLYLFDVKWFVFLWDEADKHKGTFLQFHVFLPDYESSTHSHSLSFDPEWHKFHNLSSILSSYACSMLLASELSLHTASTFSSLFDSCVVHISVTTIMSSANLYHFVSVIKERH